MGRLRFASVLGLVPLLALLVPACGGGDDSSTTSTSSSGGKSDGGDGMPAAICHKGGSKWTGKQQAFVEATSKWGLDKLGVQGTRISAVDFDGDGWTDLIVRFGGYTSDDFKPGGMRTTWLLRNTQKGTFEDVTEKSGIRQNRTETDMTIGRTGEVFAFGDVNNDGYIDVITGITTPDTSNPGKETTELLLGNADGTFTLGPAGNPFRRKTDAVAGISFVDFDRDGNLDIWITENSLNELPVQSRLYKGDGQGNFKDVTNAQGLTTKSWSFATADQLNQALGHANSWSANACDLNNDGSPELLAASYGRAPNLLWLSSGDQGGFKFTNNSIASGYSFDMNEDWHDNESARCWCKLHPTDMGCEGVPPPMYIQCTTDADAFRWDNATDQNAYRLGGNSGTTNCYDLNNDGWMDLVTGEIAHWDVGGSSDKAELMVNNKDPNVVFSRPGNDVTGLARTYPGSDWNEGIMTSTVFDFDNDGWGDVYMGNSDYPYNHGLLYHQDSAGKFSLVPLSLGIDHHRSHGSAVADFDHDGDLDIVVGHSFARCHEQANDDSDCYATQQVRLFENVIGDTGNFVMVRLVGGAGTNRAAIGARVTLKAGGVTQMKDVEGGHGHYGMQDDFALLFGLGEACEADVTIRWPDAALTQETMHLTAGHRFLIEQGKGPKLDLR